MTDKYIVVIDQGSNKKRVLVAKRHPDGTYYTHATHTSQLEAVSHAKSLNNIHIEQPQSTPAEREELAKILSEHLLGKTWDAVRDDEMLHVMNAVQSIQAAGWSKGAK